MIQAIPRFGPDDKVGLLREHFVEGASIPALCKREGISQDDLRLWKRQLFDKGARAFFEESTIPPCIRFEFQRFVTQAVALARIDSENRFEMTQNLVNDLEQAWQAAVAAGASSEAAALRAYERFGTVNSAAEILRQPFWVRLLMFQDYRPHRMLACLLLSMLLMASMYADTWFESHYMDSTIALSPSLLLFNSFFAVLPMLPFALREEDEAKRFSNDVGHEAGRIPWGRWPAKRLLGIATMILLCFPILIAYSRVPYQIVGTSDWRVGALMTIGAWILTVAAVPALACLLAETFLHPASACVLARRRVIRLARTSERGTWLVPRSRVHPQF